MENTLPTHPPKCKSDGNGDLNAREAAVVATLLAESPEELTPNIARVIESAPDSFDDERFGTLAVAIRNLQRANEPIHFVSVLAQLNGELEKIGGSIFVTSLGLRKIGLLAAEQEAALVLQAYRRRRLKYTFADVAAALEGDSAQFDSIVEHAQRALAELSEPSASDLPAIVDSSSFLAETLPLPCELVYGVLHKGSKMVLGGGSKTFKTWTLLDLAVSVAAGEPWMSFKTSKGRVLFLNFEIQPAFFQQRIAALVREKSINLPPDQFDVWNLRGRFASYQTIIPRIIKRVKKAEYALIIFDPIYKLYGDTDENAAGQVARLLNALESLAVETGAAVAFGAHYSKGNQASKESIDRISGSGVFARDPDTILNFTRHEEQDAFTVEATLRNFKPVDPFVVRWQYPLMRRADDLDPAKLKDPKGRPIKHTVEKILDLLKARKSRKWSTTEWQKKCQSEKGVPKSTFYDLLEKAKSDPKLTQTKAGQWFYEASAS
jgi:hypothetical protein